LTEWCVAAQDITTKIIVAEHLEIQYNLVYKFTDVSGKPDNSIFRAEELAAQVRISAIREEREGNRSCKLANTGRGLHIWAGRGRGSCVSRTLAEIEEKLEEKTFPRRA
jgi:hypothetical protein